MTSTSSPTGLSLSPAAIAGVVIGVVAGVGLLAVACFYLRRMGASGRFMRLRRWRATTDPEEEFASRGPSIHIRNRGYGYGQQSSAVSLEPLLISPPGTYALSGVPLVRDRSSPVLPPIDLGHASLYDADDPYSRIERAILPASRAHHLPVSSLRQQHELDELSQTPQKHSRPVPPLFINRTLTRPFGPELSTSSRTSASLFWSAEHPPSTPPRTPSDIPQFFEPRQPAPVGDTGNTHESQLRRTISKTALAEKTSREEIFSPHGAILDAESVVFNPYAPDNSDRQSRSSLRRLPGSPKLRGLSPVAEGSTTTDLPPPHDTPTNTQIVKQPSVSLSTLEKSSSLSVALSHTGHPTNANLPLLSSNNLFGKSETSSARRWTSSSSGLATRYPSLAPSSLGSSPPSSNHHSDPAAEWSRPPAGLAALTNIQLEPLKPEPSPSSTRLEIPVVPQRHTLHPSTSPAVNKTREVEPRRARLRAHAPGSVPELERRSIVEGGIASIDVSL